MVNGFKAKVSKDNDARRRCGHGVPERPRRSAGFRNSATKLEALLRRTIEVPAAAGINSRRRRTASDSRRKTRPVGANRRHSSSLAAMSARSSARLISLTLIISFSADSRNSNSDSFSIARTSSTYG